MMMKVLVTGGCGTIGAYFASFARNRYDLRLVDKVAWDEAQLGPPPGETLVMDLQDPEACRLACQGMDRVVHLAADPDPRADFMNSLLGNNILATYHIFRAAKEAGCQRIIYASSVHAVAAYPPDVQVRSDMPPLPQNDYGVAKCFGEALAAYYGTKLGLSSIVLRIGAYMPPEWYPRFSMAELDAFLDPDDFNQLLVQCLETPDIDFLIAHAISDNRFKRIDLSETRQKLGYQPVADAFEIFNLPPKEGSGS